MLVLVRVRVPTRVGATRLAASCVFSVLMMARYGTRCTPANLRQNFESDDGDGCAVRERGSECEHRVRV
eukprot:4172126-Pleurochrysis_carterae.AAC.1